MQQIQSDPSVVLNRDNGIDLDSLSQGNDISGLDLWSDSEKLTPGAQGVTLVSVAKNATADSCLTAHNRINGINLYDTYNGISPTGSKYCVKTSDGNMAFMTLNGVEIGPTPAQSHSKWSITVYQTP